MDGKEDMQSLRSIIMGELCDFVESHPALLSSLTQSEKDYILATIAGWEAEERAFECLTQLVGFINLRLMRMAMGIEPGK